MNLKNTTRRAERDDPYRLPEQDIAPRRMVAEPLRPCSSIRPPRRRALLAPRTVDPPPPASARWSWACRASTTLSSSRSSSFANSASFPSETLACSATALARGRSTEARWRAIGGAAKKFSRWCRCNRRNKERNLVLGKTEGIRIVGKSSRRIIYKSDCL